MLSEGKDQTSYQETVVEQWEKKLNGWNNVYRDVFEHWEHLKGEVLTLVEATTANNEQCEATKSIIKNQFRTVWKDLYSYFNDTLRGMKEPSIEPISK